MPMLHQEVAMDVDDTQMPVNDAEKVAKVKLERSSRPMHVGVKRQKVLDDVLERHTARTSQLIQALETKSTMLQLPQELLQLERGKAESLNLLATAQVLRYADRATQESMASALLAERRLQFETQKLQAETAYLEAQCKLADMKRRSERNCDVGDLLCSDTAAELAATTQFDIPY